MKREIKFRVFDNVLNKMLNNVSGLVLYQQFFQVHIGVSGMMTRNYEQAEIMQFTGLHDKNGKEIYEGDILSFKDRVNSFVGFENGAFILDKIMPPRPLAERMLQYGDCEIIGNIYENKDLI